MEMTKMPDLDRRRLFGAAAATLAASQFDLLVLPRRLQAMTQPIAEGPLQTTEIDFLSTERDLGVILEVFSGMPKKQTKER
jgi:hypothetical protein